MTINFAYFQAAHGKGEVAVNISKIVLLKNVNKRKYNTIIVCEGNEIEVIGKVSEIAGNIAAVG